MEECQFESVPISHKIGAVIAKTSLDIGGGIALLSASFLVFPSFFLGGGGGHAHLNKDWTLSLPIQTKGEEEERPTAARTQPSISAPLERGKRRRGTHRRTHRPEKHRPSRLIVSS